MRIRLIAALMTMVLMVTVFAGCYTYDEVIEDPVESSTSQKVTSSKPAASTSSKATSATSSKKVVVSNKPSTNNQNNGTTSKREVYSYPTIERKVLYPSGWVSKYVIMEKPSEDPGSSEVSDDGKNPFVTVDDDGNRVYYSDFSSFGSQVLTSLSELVWNGDRMYDVINGSDGPTGTATLWPYGSYLEACGAAYEFDPTNTLYKDQYERALRNVMQYNATNVNQIYGQPANTYLALNCFPGSTSSEVYYDDDVWIAKEWIHAYKVGMGDEYLTNAVRMMKYICETAWDETWKGGGLLWQDPHYHTNNPVQKNTCINAPAADAAVDLYMITGDESFLEHSKKIYAWVKGQLMDPDDHLMMDKFVYSEGKITTDGGKLGYNTGCMISAAAGLYEAEKKNGAADAEDYLADAYGFAEAGIKRFIGRTYAFDRNGNFFWTNKFSGAGSNNVWFNSYMAEGIVDLYKLSQTDKDVDAEKYIDAFHCAMAFACTNRNYSAAGWFNTDLGDLKSAKSSDIAIMGQSATARMIFMMANIYEK